MLKKTVLAVLLAGTFVLLGSSATATTVDCGPSVVTNTNDDGAGSLRQTIKTACPGTSITFNIPTSDPGFSAGIYTITLTTAELVIDKNLTIDGLGASVLTVRRSTAGGIPEFRIFSILEGVTATISGLAVTNGNAGSGIIGGGILNSGTLTLNECKIFGNSAPNGGGIQNIGTLTVNRSNVIGNAGGGIFNHYVGNNQPSAISTLTVNNSTISNNTGFGGILNDAVLGATANLFINGSTISQNSSAFSGGGISNIAVDSSVTTLVIINSTISHNNSNSVGGIYNSSVRAATASLNITNSTISGNNGTENSGAIYQLTSDGGTASSAITNGTIYANTSAGVSGAILLSPSDSSNLRLRNTIVAGNLLTPSMTTSDISGAVHTTSSFNLIGNGTGMVGISNGSNGNQVGTSAAPIDPLLSLLRNNGGPTQTHLPLPRSTARDAGNNGLLPSDVFDLDGDGDSAEVLPVDQRGAGFNRVFNNTVDIGAVEVDSSVIDDNLQLMIDESGPAANQAAALDALLLVRDPFHVRSVAEWMNLGADRNTRVILFAVNLQLNPGDPLSAVVVTLVSNGQTHEVGAEGVRVVPGFNFIQVVFRLPDNLAPGVCTVTLKANGKTSNTGTIRIVQ